MLTQKEKEMKSNILPPKEVDLYIKQLRGMLPELKKKYPISYLGVFGSYVRNEQTPLSDLDVLVEFSEPISLLEYARLELELSDYLGVRIDLVSKTALKPRIGRHTRRGGENMTLRETGGYLEDIFNAILAIQESTEGYSYDMFVDDQKTQYAVLRAIEIIGKASKNIPSSFSRILLMKWSDVKDFIPLVVNIHFASIFLKNCPV